MLLVAKGSIQFDLFAELRPILICGSSFINIPKAYFGKVFVAFNLQNLCRLQLKVTYSQWFLVELDLVHLCVK